MTATETTPLTSKAAVLETVSRMPDDVTMQEIMEALHIRTLIDEGIQQVDEGRGISHDEFKKRFSRWLS